MNATRTEVAGTPAMNLWDRMLGEIDETEDDRHTRHREKVQRIAKQLRERTSSDPVVLRKKAVSHQVPKARDHKHHRDCIEVGDLNAILDIDVKNRRCTAEAGVTFEDLVAATLPLGLVPAIVPELRTITIGGAVSGCSLESASFRFGGFHDTCTEYEVITGTGEVIRCSPKGDQALLFQMMHGTFGTLGILSELTFDLIPAKRFVRVQYTKHSDLAAMQADIVANVARTDIDFMDGIVHSPTEWVLAEGTFVDSAPYTSRYDVSKVYDQSTRELREDYLRTEDYFFRYDHGVTNVHPRSFVGRQLLGKVMGSRQLLRLAEFFSRWLPWKRPDVTLDVFIPFSQAPAFIEWFRSQFQFFPLWCVPYRRVRDYAWLPASFYAGRSDQLYLDFAVYGMKQTGGGNAYQLIEDALPRFGGLKTLSSHNYYSKETFWRTWNKENYDRVKAVTDPRNVFLDLFEKTCRQKHA